MLNLLTEKIIKFLGSKLFLYATLAWFTAQTIFMALTTKIGVPPDEFWHIAHIKLFARDGLDPFIQDQSGYYFLGDVTRGTSFLYHYLFSFFYRVIDFLGLEAHAVLLIRGANMLLGLATLLLIWKALKLLKISSVIQNLVVFMLANTMMFVFLSSSVNYDNLLFLLTAAAVLSLTMLTQKLSLTGLLGFVIILSLGVLTKYSFLPLALMLFGILVFYYRKSNMTSLLKATKIEFRNNKKVIIALILICVVLFSVSAERYAGNLIAYGRVNPKCDQVLEVKQCEQNAVYMRNSEFSKINPSPESLMKPDQFTLQWLKTMQERTFGVFAHKSYFIPQKLQLILTLFFILASVAVIRKIKLKDGLLVYLLLMAIVYYLVLLKMNWGGYSRHGIFGVALQGRYGLPVIFILYLSALYYLWALFEKLPKTKTLLFVVIAITFFLSGLPSFIVKTDNSWRTWPPGSEQTDRIE